MFMLKAFKFQLQLFNLVLGRVYLFILIVVPNKICFQAQLHLMDAAKRLENLKKLEQIKQHLLELEKQVSCHYIFHEILLILKKKLTIVRL